MARPTFLEQNLIPKNAFSSPRITRNETAAIDLHWVESAGATVDQIVRYLFDLGLQDPDDNIDDRYAGANVVIGPDKAVEVVRVNEVSYTAGADGKKRTYTPEAKKLFGATYTKYGIKSYQSYQSTMRYLSPNYKTCSIEIVHPDWTGVFEDETLSKLRVLLVWLLERYKLPTNRAIRHFDITRKKCPKCWVDNPGSFYAFLDTVDSARKLA